MPDAGMPVIVIDPARRFGRPHIKGKGISTDAIAGMIAAGEDVATVADEYGLTRHEVLLACWHEGLQGCLQVDWGEWANQVHGPLGGWEPLDVDALPDPPVPEVGGDRTGAAVMWRCTSCGKWSHAKRKPSTHKRWVETGTETVPVQEADTGAWYDADVPAGEFQPCGPFERWTARPA